MDRIAGEDVAKHDDVGEPVLGTSTTTRATSLIDDPLPTVYALDA